MALIDEIRSMTIEAQELSNFMHGPDQVTLARLTTFFSYPVLDGTDWRKCYLHPRELKLFWDSLTESEKNYYRRLVALREI